MDVKKEPYRQIDELQDIVHGLEQDNEVLRQEIAELNARLQWFEEQLRISRQKQFGASSEKTDPEQLNLFNEAEDTAEPNLAEPSLETITYERRKKRSGQREESLKDLPVEVIEYRLPEEEQICPCCQGKLHEMGAQVRQELKIIPVQVVVVEHRQFKYACRQCEREGTSTSIIKAGMPNPIMPGSLASPTILAYIADQKYTNSLPLYRQEQQFGRLGFDLSRQTMANWMVAIADPWLKTIYERLHEHLIKHEIIHADESTLQVLRESERSAESQSYMWLYRTGRDGPPVVLYDYQTTRAAKHPERFLAGFKGYLQTDGYAAYGRVPGVIQVGCFAHARRNDKLAVMESMVESSH